jgi:2-oxoisovalerate dehydrogenase E1 component
MNFDRKNISNTELLDMYKQLLWPRMIEEKMLVLLRQGRISKWFSGIGQEAISVGATMAMQSNEWIFPLHRNLGVFTSRQMPLHKLFKQWQGSQDGYSKGRERSFHFGSKEHYICGMISHLGPQMALADGVALAYKLAPPPPEGGSLQNTTLLNFQNLDDSKTTKQVAHIPPLGGRGAVSLAFTGDGGTSEGDFHEALNVAAVWDLPVIFIIENNGYGLSTPTNEQYRCENLVDRAKGYGMEGIRIDGNNILEVYETIKGVREYCHTQQKPYLIECMTFRMRGHEEASGVKYVPAHLFEQWQLKDPITNYENYLKEQGILNDAIIEKIKAGNKERIESELVIGFNSPAIKVNTEEELEDVYSPPTPQGGILQTSLDNATNTNLKNSSNTTNTKPTTPIPPSGGGGAKYFEAIKSAMHQSLQHHSNLIIMGQDIAEYGGAFKLTEGFAAEFGKDRIRNTPICESAIVGIALGLSLEGYKSIMEMQFADFATVGFNQIVNNLAKIHYRWGQNADVVIRMPTGGGVGAGPFHSQSNEAWFTKVPGLKVVYPATAYDAKGLLIAAINDPNPVLFFEHKALYRSVSDHVPTEMYEVEIGKANVVQEGTELSIITYGQGVHWAKELSTKYEVRNTNNAPNSPLATYHSPIEILDLRTLAPLDYDAIKTTVQKTGKVLLLTEDTTIGSIASELSAWINENCFEHLDAPVLRCGSLETPIPFNLELEKNFMANARLEEMVEKLMRY